MRHRLRIPGLFLLFTYLLTSIATAASWTSVPQGLSAQPLATQAIGDYMLVDPEASVVLESRMEAESPSSPVLAALLVNAFLAKGSGDINASTQVGEGLRAIPSGERKLRVGTTCRRVDLLHAMLMTGARDAALALALGAGEDEAGYVRRMNDQAAAWGLRHTVFVHADGRADPAQRTTLEDLSIIAAQVMLDPDIREILTKTEYAMPEDIGYGTLLQRSWGAWEPRVVMGMEDSGEPNVYLQYAMDGTRPLLLIASGAGEDVPARTEAVKALIAHGFEAYQRIDLYEIAKDRSDIVLRIGDTQIPAYPVERDTPMYCILSSKSLADHRISFLPKEDTVEAFHPTMYYADADVMLGSTPLGTIQLYARIQEVMTPEPIPDTPEPTMDAVAANVRPDDGNVESHIGGRMPMLLIWIGIAAVVALGMNAVAWFIRRGASAGWR